MINAYQKDEVDSRSDRRPGLVSSTGLSAERQSELAVSNGRGVWHGRLTLGCRAVSQLGHLGRLNEKYFTVQCQYPA